MAASGGRATTWLAWLLPVIAWAPLTHPGYFEFHSGFLPVFNLNDLIEHFALGWVPLVGQPYDLLRGEGMLPYLLAAALRILGATPVAAIKWVFGLSLLAGALGMYAWAGRRLGAWPALIAAVAYVTWPPLLATTLVRGALAEALLLGLAPWLLWAADVTSGSRRWPAAVVLAVGLAAALWTQAGLALWLAAGVLLTLFFAARVEASRRSAPTAASLLAWAGGLCLGGMGLLPALLSRGPGNAAGVAFADHLVYPHQFLWSGWGRGPSIAGPDDTLTFQVGLVACGLALVGLVIGRHGRDDPEEGATPSTRGVALPAAAITAALVLLSSTPAAPLWRLLPFPARGLTYPWQLLLLAGPWLAWLAGRGAGKLAGLLPAGKAGAVVPLFAGLVVLLALSAYSDPAAGHGQAFSPPIAAAPAPDAPVAIFGNHEIALLSAEPAGRPGPGGRIAVQVRWQALRPLAQDYTVFLHVVGPDGKRWGQQDTMPQGGRLPTSRWQPGQIVTDEYQVILEPDAPVGAEYRYLLGLYLLESGRRLAAGADDKVVLAP